MLHLTDEQLDWIAERIPDAVRSPKGGRPPADKRQMLRAIFWMLDNGAKWKDLPRVFGSKSTVHRWFQRWTRAGVFEQVMRAAGRLVEERDGYRLYECFIDGSYSRARGAWDGVARTRLGKSVKIMVLVDAVGIPVAVDTASSAPHESQLVQPLFEFMLPRETPPRVIGDKAYDSDPLDAALAARGIELIAPHRENRTKPPTQDGRPLRRMRRRWKVERTIAWFKNFRRLYVRWDRFAKHYQGFLHFACVVLLLRQVLG
jgi:transposase